MMPRMAALAELRGCEFWTADKTFYDAVKAALIFVNRLSMIRKELGTAHNRAYLAPVLRTFAQIPHRETSDTPGTLCKMLFIRANHH